MKKKTLALMGLFIFVLSSQLAWAVSPPFDDVMHQVVYQASVEQWVTTDSAKVMVNIEAALNQTELAKAREAILANLNRIAEGKWFITQFNRSQDSSGVERLSVMAEARVKENLLGKVRSNAEAVSKPGAKYTIANIDFTPSLEELEKVRHQLRDQLYNTVKQELAQLNQVYPEQRFVVHRLNFIRGVQAMYAEQPSPRESRKMMMALAQQDSSMSVSNKVEMTVLVVFSANNEQEKSNA